MRGRTITSKKWDIPVEDDVCPECGGGNTVYDGGTGEVICGACGLVLHESTISLGPEWRDFTPGEEETRSRVGAPFSFAVHDNGLSTVIGAYGRNNPLNTRLQMLRLRRWQVRSRVHSSTDRNLAQAMVDLDRLSNKLHLPLTIKEKAAIIYRKALNQGLVRGRSISAIIAASLYAACRMTQTQRTIREIARVSTIDKKDIARIYRLILRELSIQMPIPDAQLGVPKIAAKVGVSEKTQQKAVEILRRAAKLKITAGKDPMGLAAAALYTACQMMNEKRTQKMIADAAGVTEVTIRNRYRWLKDILELEVPSGHPRTRQDGVRTWEERRPGG